LIGAGVVGTVAANQIHAITAALALSLMVGVALVVLLFVARRLRLLRDRLRTVLSFAVPALVLTLAVNFIMIGRWSEGDAVNGLPNLGPDGFDPTWAFARLVGTGRNVSLPSAGYHAPDTSALALDSLQAHLYGTPPDALFALCIALGAGLLITVAWSKRSRRLLLFSAIAFGCVFLISYLISQTGDTYVPRRTGYSRLLQLWPVIPLIAVGAALGAIRWRVLRWAASALLVVGSVIVVWRGHARVDYLAVGQPSAVQLAAVQSAPIPAGATVLTNGYTQGFVTLQTKGQGLLDGHAPYLEKHLLADTNTILNLAREYFMAPAQNPFPFSRYNVSYVVAAKARYTLGTPVIWTAGLAQLNSDPHLRLLGSNRWFSLYQVIG
jgi:hypothetical protein